MKIKHKCEYCAGWAKAFADWSKEEKRKHMSKIYVDLSKDFAEKCQCKKGESR